ncbi:MAG: YihA family ribosome biogenesis GTP-binding protein [Calditrichaeota bacterium]|nr:MAG: YihA family ribosome biogenesis GTP-binding protein [Calditrichota bacterium]
MKIISVEFIKSAANISHLPKDSHPHVAFAGRSNVGKSSLLNKLFNRKRMALVSSTPGKTRLLNFFLINENTYFVDLPGYGYAKVPKSMKQKWQNTIERYLSNCRELMGVVLLTDIRHAVQPTDVQFIEWLAAMNIPLILVGTKADKLSNQKLQHQLAENQKIIEPFKIDHIVPFSAINGMGKNELLHEIDRLLSASRNESPNVHRSSTASKM